MTHSVSDKYSEVLSAIDAVLHTSTNGGQEPLGLMKKMAWFSDFLKKKLVIKLNEAKSYIYK